MRSREVTVAVVVVALACVGAASGRTPSASFTMTGALRLVVNKSALCIPVDADGARQVSFPDPKAPGISVMVHEFKTGNVDVATTRDDVVIVQETGSKPEVWIAGWSGASLPGHPSPHGAHYGWGTLHVTALTGASGRLDVLMKPAPKTLAPGNAANGSIHLTARWSC
jgi:hypothetical protein